MMEFSIIVWSQPLKLLIESKCWSDVGILGGWNESLPFL
jgi:hypothetical protein